MYSSLGTTINTHGKLIAELKEISTNLKPNINTGSEVGT